MDRIFQLYTYIDYFIYYKQNVFDPSKLQECDYYDVLDEESKKYNSTHRIV